MDKLTEAKAVLPPKRRVNSDTLMTDSLTLEPPVVALGHNFKKPAHRDEGASLARCYSENMAIHGLWEQDATVPRHSCQQCFAASTPAYLDNLAREERGT